MLFQCVVVQHMSKFLQSLLASIINYTKLLD